MNRLYNETSVQNIADAIREKKGYTGKNLFNYEAARDINNTIVSSYRIFTIDNLQPNVVYELTGYSMTEPTTGYIYLWNEPSYSAPNKAFISSPSAIVQADHIAFPANSEGKIYLAIFDTTEAIWNENIAYFENAMIRLQSITDKTYEPYCRYKIGDMENAIDTLKVIAEQEATGYPLNLTKGINGRTLDYKVYGNSKQETTTGKQLFNAHNIINSNIEVLDDGASIVMPLATSGNGYTITSTKLKDLCPDLKVDDICKLTFTRSLGREYNLLIYIETAGITWNEGQTKTITQEMLDNNVILYGNRFSGGETGQCIIRNLTITKDTTYTYNNFEPYTGGIASPNPDYSQEIKSVGDLVTSGEHAGKYKIPVISSGKNSLDIQKIVKGRLDNGVIGYESNTTELTLNKDSFSFTTNANYRGAVSDYIELPDFYDYIWLSSTTSSSNINYSLSYYDNNKNYLSSSSGNVYNTNRRYANVPNAKYVRMWFCLNTLGNITINKPMIEFSTTATPYEPYHKSITTNIYLDKPLRKIGNVKDEINFANGKRINNIGEVILDGVNSKIDSVAQAGNLYYATCNLTKNSKQNYELMSNMFIAGYLDEGKFYIANASGSIMVFVHTNQTLTTKELWNNWLTTHNVEAIYQLATPTEENIDIPPIPTFEGTTIITIGSETEPTEMYAKYYKFV